jgi:hypothetical protein
MLGICTKHAPGSDAVPYAKSLLTEGHDMLVAVYRSTRSSVHVQMTPRDSFVARHLLIALRNKSRDVS